MIREQINNKNRLSYFCSESLFFIGHFLLSKQNKQQRDKNTYQQFDTTDTP